MYRLKTKNTKTDAVARWNLPDRVFFACGACHILAFAFSQKYPHSDFKPHWIKPERNAKGNHIVMVKGPVVFDYHGYSKWPEYIARYERKARRECNNWSATIHELRVEVLISGDLCKEYDGLILREPKQFLYNALPRAQKYLERFNGPGGHQYV